MACEALTGHTVRVADCDGAAVDVELVHRNAQLVGAIQNLHGKGFNELPQVNVAHLEAQLGQHRGTSEDRAYAHFVGLATGHGKA